MTEVAQPKLFTNLNPDYMISNSLFGPSIDDEQNRIYDKVNALGGRREEGLRRTPDGVGHSGDVANIWDEEEDRDKEEEGEDSGLYEVPVETADPGYDLDRFVEDEFQFLDSDDDDDNEGEGRRLSSQVPLLGTLKDQQPEILDRSPSPQPSVTGPLESTEEALDSALEEPVVGSRSLISQGSLDVDGVSVADLGAPFIPAPPPLPPTGALLAMNRKSETEEPDIGDGQKSSHYSGAVTVPETIHGAGIVPLSTRPKDRPKNEPQSPQNEHFLELQGILNRRLRKIDEDMERNREAEGSMITAAAAVVPIRQAQESINHQKSSEQAVIDKGHHLNSFLPEVPSGAEESGAAEKINRAIPVGTKAAHGDFSPALTLVGGSTNFLQDPMSVEPPQIESSARHLPNISDSVATEVREEFSSRGKDFESITDFSSQTLPVPGQLEGLENKGLTAAQTIQTEAKERFEVPGDENVRTFISDVNPGLEQLRSRTDAVDLHSVSSPASVPDVVTSSIPHSVDVLAGDHFISPPIPLETNPVVKRGAEQTTRPRPNSSTTAAVHFWDTTPSEDEWTPQMDLMDNEFDDDFPTEIISRRHHHQQKRQPDKAKRTPSKLYKKKEFGGPQRPAPNPGAFSLARINRAVKKVFGSISSKPSSKQRSPISDSVFLQEDGWEIYPARPYDQSNPGEAVKVVGVEKRPAYAYNAFTRQLVILPDHDRILVTDDGRRIRDHNGKAVRPTSPGGNAASVSKTGNREKSRHASRSKASSPRPPNLNTKTVKSIQMHHERPASIVDSQMGQDEAYWRRNSSPHFVNPAAAASSNLSKKKTSTLSQILSFRKPSGRSSAESGKKVVDERLTASDVELLKKGGQAARQVVATRPI